MSESEPWKDGFMWASSDLSIAIGRCKVAIARALPREWGLKMETRGVNQICDALKWQEEEQEYFERARNGRS
jgi:hypothetical protein